MLRCNKCGKINDYKDGVCANCGNALDINKLETEEILNSARADMKSRNYESAVEKFRALAYRKHPEACREWAAILERGSIVPRDLDGAMKHYFIAAVEGDAYSAYKYSRLAMRTSTRSADFWLAVSALMGAREAYPATAKMYSDRGDEDTATYYYALAAECDDVEAIVTLARRYYDGTVTAKNDGFAKWYMDKLTLPPLFAIRLAYRLRSVKAEEPPRPSLAARDAIIVSLIHDAKSYGLDKTAFLLSKLYAEGGSAEATFMLAKLTVEGTGTKKDPTEGLKLLESAAAKGSAEAARYLGDLFITDTDFPRDTRKALTYYKRAAELGRGDAYEALGDIFYEGTLVKRDIPYAIELYTEGAKEGEENSRKKARELIERREGYFEVAEAETSDPGKAYKCYAISASMGHTPAFIPLASCFEFGVGTKKNRHEAFLWYSAAAETKDKDGIYELGRCYATGMGTAFNYKKAVETLRTAARLGVKEAEDELIKLYAAKKKHMSRALYSSAMRLLYKKKLVEARRILEAGAALSHPAATYTLGCLCEFGIGGVCDREKAFSLYNHSFDLKFRDARQRYKLKVLQMTR